MHNIDRAMFEMQQEQEANHEFPGEVGNEWESWETGQELHESYENQETYENQEQHENYESYETELHEMQEMELAGRLLEVSTEAELEEFLGNLVRGAVSAGRAFVNSSAGRAVGGLLKGAAKQVLPSVGAALGNMVVPGIGGAVGSRAASWLASKLELEGLSHEDREFEAARAFVRFANAAARNAARAPRTAPPAQVAVNAAMLAARRNLPVMVPVIQQLTPPGMSGPVLSGPAVGPRRRPTSGRWVRRGSTIVLLNT